MSAISHVTVCIRLDAPTVQVIDRIAFARQQTRTKRVSRTAVIRDAVADFVSTHGAASVLQPVATAARHRMRVSP